MIEQTKERGKIVGLIYPHNKVSAGFMQKMILDTLTARGQDGATEELLLSVNRIVRQEETLLDVRRELDFLVSVGWVDVRKEIGNSWIANVTQEGVSVAGEMHKAFMRKTYLQ